MRYCYVHFGMPKTGSTSIQNTLFHNCIDENFKYISLNGGQNQNIPIITLFADEEDLNVTVKNIGLDRRWIDNNRDKWSKNMDRAFEGNKKKNLLLSTEAFGTLKEKALYRFKDYLEGKGYKIQLVGYIRTPKSFMESAYQQRLKTHYIALNLPQLYPHYQKRFEKFDTVFGRNNVILWKFDPKALFQGNVGLDFCYRLGIKVDTQPSMHLNKGLSLDALKLLYIYRMFGTTNNIPVENLKRSNHRIEKKLSSLAGEKLRIHSDIIAPFLAQNKNDIKWIEHRLKENMNEDIYAHDKCAIRKEEELMTVSKEALDWLYSLTGQTSSTSNPQTESSSPHHIAKMVQLLANI